MKELRKKIDKMNKEINEIINKVKLVMDNIEIYYKICNNILNNNIIENRNYEIIKKYK